MTQAQRSHGLLFHVLDVAFNIVVIAAIVGGIRTFLVSPFQVDGKSMESTLEDREYIIINKLAYYLGEPDRGDVVVFRPPTPPDHYFVKRVIGLPGDEVTIRDGWVYLKRNGEETEEKLEEPYLNETNLGHTYRDSNKGDATPVHFTVPDDSYFLLGDNRLNSTDSRIFRDESGQPAPYIASSEIQGRVWVVALPISRIHALEAPVYE